MNSKSVILRLLLYTRQAGDAEAQLQDRLGIHLRITLVSPLHCHLPLPLLSSLLYISTKSLIDCSI